MQKPRQRRSRVRVIFYDDDGDVTKSRSVQRIILTVRLRQGSFPATGRFSIDAKHLAIISSKIRNAGKLRSPQRRIHFSPVLDPQQAKTPDSYKSGVVQP